MARPGVTLEAVESAVATLKDRGQSVTTANVRAVLGTGSLTTILGHLQALKATPAVPVVAGPTEALPPGLLAAMQVAAEQWYGQARTELQAQIDEARAEIEQQQIELRALKAESDRAQEWAASLEVENAQLREDLARQSERSRLQADEVAAAVTSRDQAREDAKFQFTKLTSALDINTANFEKVSGLNVQLERRNAVLEEALRRCESGKPVKAKPVAKKPAK